MSRRTYHRILFGCAIAAVLAVACGDSPLGVDAGMTPLEMGYGVHATPTPVVSFLQTQGVKWVRLTYYYQTIGDSAWTRSLARDLDTLSTVGFSIDLVIHSTPWNDPDGVGIPHAVAELMRQHPGAIDAVELYNEENVGVDYWKPILPGATDYERGTAYAARYTAMRDTVQALYPLLHVPVVTGGTAGDPEQFLRGIKDAGVTPDIVAVHAYGFPPAVALDQFVKESRRVFPTTRVWATEVGSEGGRTDSTTLALDIGGVLAWMRQYPDVRVFWVNVWGDPIDGILSYDTFLPRAGATSLVTAGPFQ